MPDYGPFRGFHRRDNPQLVPSHYLWEATNIDFKGEATILRPRFELRTETTLAIAKMFDFSRTNVNETVSSSLLALTKADDATDPKRLKDLTRNVDVLNEDVTNFFAVSYLHRAFILTQDGSTKRDLHYYDGEDYRAASLDFDDTTLPITVTFPNSGNVFAGNYHVGYVLETDTGYLSVPYGLVDYISSGTPGSLVRVTGGSPKSLTVTADFDSLPSHIKKVHFISTSDIPSDTITYPADSFTYYFIPGGSLVRNAGSFAGTKELSYFPPSLFANVNHLKLQHGAIEGGDGLAIYNNRLCIWGGTEISDQSILRISRINEPESFSRTTGFLVVAPEVNSPITNVYEFRGDVYITKRDSTYVTRDNGGEPATWPVVTLDEGLGAEKEGVSSILASQGTSLDFVAVATSAGLCYFDGTYKRPELSWNIEDLWQTPKALVRDPTTKRIYCLVDNDIYVCNYEEGTRRKNLRWYKWTFGFDIDHIIINSDKKLNLASPDGIYIVDDEAAEDVIATFRTGALAGGAHGSPHFGNILVSMTSGVLTVESIGRLEGRQGAQTIEVGEEDEEGGIYRALYAFTDHSIQVEFVAAEDFELETIFVFVERLWEEPLSD